MNKKLYIVLGLIISMAFSASVSYAETTIYTDGIGRMHFLGKDPASNTINANYTNPEQQDLTRKLYENSTGDVNYVDYKLKDYDNTFGFGRMDTQTLWRNKFSNNVDDAALYNSQEKTVKGNMTFQKGAADASRANAFGATNIDSAKEEVNVIKETNTKKTKFWRKRK